MFAHRIYCLFRGHSGRQPARIIRPLAPGYHRSPDRWHHWRPWQRVQVRVRHLCRRWALLVCRPSAAAAAGGGVVAPMLPLLDVVARQPELSESEALDALSEVINRGQRELSGWERVCQMWTRDDFGQLSPDLDLSLTLALIAGLLGMVYGGAASVRDSAANFKQKNLVTRFEAVSVAHQKYHDRIMVGFIRGGWALAWRMALFVFVYQTILMTLSVYHYELRLDSYALAGAAAGAVIRINRGLVAISAAATAGCFLSLVVGLLIKAAVVFGGMTFENVRYCVYHRAYERQKAHKILVEKKLEKQLLKGGE